MIDHAAIAAAAIARLAAEILASGLSPGAPELAESRRQAVYALETLADHGDRGRDRARRGDGLHAAGTRRHVRGVAVAGLGARDPHPVDLARPLHKEPTHMNTMLPTLPTIHSNGSGKRHLIDDVVTAATALQKAMEAWAQAGPNGRDYYPQGPDAYGRACDEHDAVMAKMREVYVTLEQRVNALYKLPG